MNTKPKLAILLVMLMVIISGILVNLYLNSNNILGSGELHSKNDDYSIKKIRFPFRHFTSMQIEGNKLYACVDSKGTGSLDKLIQYDIVKGDYEVLFETEFSPSALQNLMMNEKWSIWLDCTMGWEKIRIYRQDRSNDEVKMIYQLDSSFSNLDTPYLYNDYLCWTSYDAQKHVLRLKLYDLMTDEMEDIYEFEMDSHYNSYPKMNQDKLVFTDNISEKGVYLVLDLNTRELETYEAQCKYPAFAVYSSGKIIFRPLDDYRVWSRKNFGIYDTASREHAELEFSSPPSRFTVKDDMMAVLIHDEDADYVELYKIETSGIREVAQTPPQEDLCWYGFSYSGELIVGYSPMDRDMAEIYILSTAN